MTLRARWSEAGADHSGPTAARPTKAPMGFPWLDETTGNLYVQTPIGMQVFAVAGLTATAAELNILSGCNATYVELNRASGVTQGTVTAQKNVVVDASKDIADFRNIGYTGAITAKGGAAAAAVVLRFGDTVTEGLEVRVIDEEHKVGQVHPPVHRPVQPGHAQPDNKLPQPDQDAPQQHHCQQPPQPAVGHRRFADRRQDFFFMWIV